MGLVALATAACGSGGSSSGASDGGGDAYQWGLNVETSGPLAFYGEGIRDGVQAYVDQVNADGGINGHKIELTVLDNGGDAARTATNVTQLATSKNVNAIFGPTLSASCSAGAPNAERYKVAMACTSVAELNDWVYSMGASNLLAAGPSLRAVKELTGLDSPKVAVAHNNALSVVAMADSIEELADAEGVEIVAREEHDIAASDFSANISKIVASKPDAVIISGTGSAFLPILKGIRAAGLKDIPIVWIDGTANLGQLVDVDDPALYGMSTKEFVTPDSTGEAAVNYVEARSAQLDEVNAATLNDGNAGTSYMTASGWGAALEQCGFPCTGEQLRDALNDVDLKMPGLVPTFAYDSERHYPYPGWYLYQVEKGAKYTLAGTYEN